MKDDAGNTVGNAYSFKKGDPIPEQEPIDLGPPPIFIPVAPVSPAPPPIFIIAAYRNPAYDVGGGVAWYGISVEVSVAPDTLNLASNGKYVMANVTFPPEIVLEDVDLYSLRFNRDAVQGLIACPCEALTHVKFLRAEVIDIYQTSDVGEETGRLRQEEAVIFGSLLDGTVFAGVDTIKIIDPAY